MNDFPEFMKNRMNHIDSSQQNTPDIDGYFYEGRDGSQICFWTYFSDRDSKENVHEFDEYVICAAGEYVEIFNGEEHILHAGDELLIPKGTPPSRKSKERHQDHTRIRRKTYRLSVS